MDTGLRNEPSQDSADPRASWLPVLESELRRRVGWVDELVSPFARGKRRAGAKTTAHRVSADTLRFSTAERKSA